jgi:hypothetical protein
MKHRIRNLVIALASLLALSHLSSSFAQGTAFTYSGRLDHGRRPANGLYDFGFKLYSDPLAATQVGGSYFTNAVRVTKGMFVTTVDFGEGIFTGSNYWLEVEVRTAGESNYTALAPLQAVTPTPYSIFAGTAGSLSGTLPAAQLSGAIPLPQLPLAVLTNNGTGVTLNGSFSGNGSGLTGVNATSLGGLATGNFWQTTGNVGTSPTNGNFVGTVDNQPLELHVNGLRAFRLEPAGGNPNVIGGGSGNLVQPSVASAFIGGGNSNQIDSSFATIGGGCNNSITNIGIGSVIGGGSNNLIAGNSYLSVIAGGVSNTIGQPSLIGITYPAYESVIGGGVGNSIPIAFRATIAGGAQNTVSVGGGTDNTIAGGYGNKIFTDDTAYHDSIGGGSGNAIQIGWSEGCTIAGGDGNIITYCGSPSTIAGGSGNYIDSYGGSSIGGGAGNRIGNWDEFEYYGGNGTIAGGSDNFVAENSGTIGGGQGNSVTGTEISISENLSVSGTVAGGTSNVVNGGYGMIPGGFGNSATNYAFAAGRLAEATNQGAFVWADSTGTAFASTNNDSFMVRASGGVGFYTSPAGIGGSGVYLAANGGSWASVSDRNAKKNIQPVDAQAVLDKLAGLPIDQWNYKWEKDSDVPNIGPMAQDFKRAFYPGRDDRSISTLEFDGVELAAIQALNERLNAQLGKQAAQMKEKDAAIQSLEDRLDRLEKMVANPPGQH